MLDWCRRAAPCALLAIAASWACEDDETRPGRAQDCNEPACLDARGDSFPLPLPTSPGDGNGGAAGGGGMPGATGELAGSVLEIASQDLSTARSVTSSVEVRAENPSGGDDIVVQPASDGSYRLRGIELGIVWVGVGNFEDPPIEPFMDTLQGADSRRAGVTDLLVVRTDVLRQLAATAFLTQTVELDLERAHLILRFVDTDERPVEGVEIVFPSPDSVPIAYDAGDTYSDGLPTTATRGMAVLLNVDAPPWPGSPLAIVAELDGEPFRAGVQVASGAVTVVTARVPDP